MIIFAASPHISATMLTYNKIFSNTVERRKAFNLVLLTCQLQSPHQPKSCYPKVDRVQPWEDKVFSRSSHGIRRAHHHSLPKTLSSSLVILLHFHSKYS